MLKYLLLFCFIGVIWGDVPTPSTPPPVDTPMLGPIPAPVPAPGPLVPVPTPGPEDEMTVEEGDGEEDDEEDDGEDGDEEDEESEVDPEVRDCRVACQGTCSDELAACENYPICMATLDDESDENMYALSQDDDALAAFTVVQQCYWGCARYCGPFEDCADICMNTLDEDCPFNGGADNGCCDDEFIACWGNEECSMSLMAGDDGDDGGGVLLLQEGDGLPPFLGTPGGEGDMAYMAFGACIMGCGLDCYIHEEELDPVEECGARCMGATCAAEVAACTMDQYCGPTYAAAQECPGAGAEELLAANADAGAKYAAIRECAEPCMTTCLTDIFTGLGVPEADAAVRAETGNPYRPCDCFSYCEAEVELCESNDNCAIAFEDAYDCLQGGSPTGCWADAGIDDVDAEHRYQIAYGCMGGCILSGPERSCPDFFGYAVIEGGDGDICQEEYEDCTGTCLTTVLAIGKNATTLAADDQLVCSAQVIATAGDLQDQTIALLECAGVVTANDIAGPISEWCDDQFLAISDIANCWLHCGEEPPEPAEGEEAPFNLRSVCGGESTESPVSMDHGTHDEEDVSSVTSFSVSLGLVVVSLALISL